MGPFLDLKNSAVTSSSESFSTQWIKMVKTIAARVAELSTKVLIGKCNGEVVICICICINIMVNVVFQ